MRKHFLTCLYMSSKSPVSALRSTLRSKTTRNVSFWTAVQSRAVTGVEGAMVGLALISINHGRRSRPKKHIWINCTSTYHFGLPKKKSVSLTVTSSYLTWNQHRRAQRCFCVTLLDLVLSVKRVWQPSSSLGLPQPPTEPPGTGWTGRSWTGHLTTCCLLGYLDVAVGRASGASGWSYCTGGQSWEDEVKRRRGKWKEIGYS